MCFFLLFCFFQAEDGIRYLVRSRGLGDVYKRQAFEASSLLGTGKSTRVGSELVSTIPNVLIPSFLACLLYTSDAADERSSVDLGGRRIIKKKNIDDLGVCGVIRIKNK